MNDSIINDEFSKWISTNVEVEKLTIEEFELMKRCFLTGMEVGVTLLLTLEAEN